MKKFVLALLILVVAATGAFADDNFSLSGYGKVGFSPFGITFHETGDPDLTSWSSAWGSPGTYTSVTIKGSVETAGVVVNFTADSGALAVDTNAYGWWKPISQVEIRGGMFAIDNLRGKIGDWSDFAYYNTVSMKNADAIFSRIKFSGNSYAAVGGILTPVEGLTIAFGIKGYDFAPTTPAVDATTPDQSAVNDAVDAANNRTAAYYTDSFEKAWKRGQYAIGYELKDILLARVQYVGLDSKCAGNVEKIEAAVQVKAIPDVNLDVGVKIPLDFDKDPIAISVGVQTSFGGFALPLRFDAQIGVPGVENVLLDPHVVLVKPYAFVGQFFTEPSYGLSDTIKVGAALAFKLGVPEQLATYATEFDFYAAPFVQFGFGGGYFKAGVGIDIASTGDFILNLPLVFIYSL